MRLRVIHPRFRLALIAAAVLLLSFQQVGCQDKAEALASALEAGRSAAEAGQHGEAIVEFRKALKADPNSAEAHFGLGESFVETGKGREALWEFAEAVRLDPTNLDARLKLATLALLGKGFEQALEQGLVVAEARPDDSTAQLVIGQALEGLGRQAEAEEAYRRAVSIAPEDASLLNVLAGYYVRVGDADSAEPILIRQTEVAPSFFSYTALARFYADRQAADAEAAEAFGLALEVATPVERAAAYDNLARFYASRGDGAAASRVLEQGIAALDGEVAGTVQLISVQADLFSKLGQDDRAIAEVKRAIEIDPSSASSLLLLASFYEKKGDPLGALDAAERAAEAAPDNTAARLKKAELMMRVALDSDDAAQGEEALRIVDDVLAGEPTHPGALFVKGKLLLARGEMDAAADTLRRATDADPTSAQAHFALGRALAAQGETRAARAAMARALEIDPAMTAARHSIIRLHSALGEFEYAIQEGRTYLRKNSDPTTRMLVAQSLARLGRTQDALVSLDRIPESARGAEFYFARARLRLEDGQADEARGDVLRALSERPGHPGILAVLLDVDIARGAPRDFQSHLDSALRARPDDAALVRLHADYAAATGDEAKAGELLQRTIELQPTDLVAIQKLALLHRRNGRLAEAAALYEQALAAHPDSAPLHYQRATLYQAEGDTERAIAAYERTLELDDRNAAAMNNLAYVLAESGADLDRALDLAQEAKALRPEDPGTADTLGWVLYLRGIPSAAVGYLREAVAGMEPGTDAIGLVRHHLALAYEANDQDELAIEALELSLAELESRQSATRDGGRAGGEPEWAKAAREQLVRLKAKG